jgi:hypothetical protein
MGGRRPSWAHTLGHDWTHNALQIEEDFASVIRQGSSFGSLCRHLETRDIRHVSHTRILKGIPIDSTVKHVTILRCCLCHISYIMCSKEEYKRPAVEMGQVLANMDNINKWAQSHPTRRAKWRQSHPTRRAKWRQSHPTGCVKCMQSHPPDVPSGGSLTPRCVSNECSLTPPDVPSGGSLTPRCVSNECSLIHPTYQVEAVSPHWICQLNAVSPHPTCQVEAVSPHGVWQLNAVSPHPTYQVEAVSPHPTYQVETVSPHPTCQMDAVAPHLPEFSFLLLI